MLSSPSLGRLAFQSLALVASAAPAFAQSPASSPNVSSAPLSLERFVLSASRTPQDPHYTPSSVSLVSLDELSVEQVPMLSAALSEQPGVIVSSTGATGA